MPTEPYLTTEKTADVLAHIHSLGVASHEEIGRGYILALWHKGLIEQVWVGSYALTEAGEQARRRS